MTQPLPKDPIAPFDSIGNWHNLQNVAASVSGNQSVPGSLNGRLECRDNIMAGWEWRVEPGAIEGLWFLPWMVWEAMMVLIRDRNIRIIFQKDWSGCWVTKRLCWIRDWSKSIVNRPRSWCLWCRWWDTVCYCKCLENFERVSWKSCSEVGCKRKVVGNAGLEG